MNYERAIKKLDDLIGNLAGVVSSLFFKVCYLEDRIRALDAKQGKEEPEPLVSPRLGYDE